jgi:hypothetical protein
MKPNNLRHFLMVQEGVQIKVTEDHRYACFIGPLRICNDGVGPLVPSDPHQQRKTAYNPFLDASVDLYIVFPPQMRTGLRPVVLGSLGRVTNLRTQATSWGVWGESGPSTKAGEVSYALGRLLHTKVALRPKVIGDNNAHYFYEMFVGVPAIVGRKHYHLITAAGRLVK